MHDGPPETRREALPALPTPLVDAATLSWSNSYERPRNDLIALQHDLVTAIVREMGVAVTREEATRLDDRQPVASEAYVAYLRGRYFWDQRTEEGLRRAIPFFEDAIRLSPDYAAAYAGLADVYGLLPRHSTVDPKPLLAQSRRYALRALELDPGVADRGVRADSDGAR